MVVMMVVVVVGGDNNYRPATTRLSRQVRNNQKKKEKKSKTKAQWESRVIIISNRISVTATSASGCHITKQHSFMQQRSRGGSNRILTPRGVSHKHAQSHDTCIGGDLDTDPALRFRIGGSCNLSRSVSKMVKEKNSENKEIEEYTPRVPGSR